MVRLGKLEISSVRKLVEIAFRVQTETDGKIETGREAPSAASCTNVLRNGACDYYLLHQIKRYENKGRMIII